MATQYQEWELVLEDFFKNQDAGFIVDCGASDGEINSNSWDLLKRPGWGGLLIEPLVEAFEILQDTYRGRDNVECLNVGIGSSERVETFYEGGQVSTFCEEWKARCEDIHSIDYTEIQMQLRPLSLILDERGITEVDFLSIDAEGLDCEALYSLDFDKCKPRLICTEAKSCCLPSYYEEHFRTRGNVFYRLK